MSRLPLITTTTADDAQRALLEATASQLGRVPNLYAALATAPAALSGYLAMRDALSKGVLSSRLREQIALLVAQENECGYCVAAHTFRGTRMRMSEDDLVRTRRAEDSDPHGHAILQITHALMAERGRISDDQIAEARAAGVTDAEFAEITAHIALNTLSNYFNHLAQPDLDFPAVDLTLPEPAAA